MEKEEEELQNEIADKTKLLKTYHPENVNKQLESKEQKIDTVKDTVKNYTDNLLELRNENSSLEEDNREKRIKRERSRRELVVQKL